LFAPAPSGDAFGFGTKLTFGAPMIPDLFLTTLVDVTSGENDRKAVCRPPVKRKMTYAKELLNLMCAGYT
jgi:hypothetical protein